MRGGVAIIILIISINVRGAGGLVIPGGREAGIGFASVSLAGPWSVFNNQAGLAWEKKFSAGAGIGNHFLLKEMSMKALCGVFPTRHGSAGFSLSHYGFSLYNELTIGLSYGLPLARNFSLGAGIRYLRVSIGGDYGSKNTGTCEVGLQYRATDKVTLGVHIYNPIAVKLSKNPSERLPVIFRLGISWLVLREFLLAAEVETGVPHSPRCKAGVEYHFVKPVYIRAGFITSPGQFTFGLGLELSKVKLDFASSYQAELGYSPQGSLIYIFN
jgi:hypothetical protein